MNINIEATGTVGKTQCSPAQALAMKNAALKAVLGYLELKTGPGEQPVDATALRYHRLVELALEAPCELGSEEQSRFEVLDLKRQTAS